MHRRRVDLGIAVGSRHGSSAQSKATSDRLASVVGMQPRPNVALVRKRHSESSEQSVPVLARRPAKRLSVPGRTLAAAGRASRIAAALETSGVRVCVLASISRGRGQLPLSLGHVRGRIVVAASSFLDSSDVSALRSRNPALSSSPRSVSHTGDHPGRPGSGRAGKVGDRDGRSRSVRPPRRLHGLCGAPLTGAHGSPRRSATFGDIAVGGRVVRCSMGTLQSGRASTRAIPPGEASRSRPV